MNPNDTAVVSSKEDVQTNIDFSDLLGANQAFPANPDAGQQTALIDANCNKIGEEGPG
jgi:hypothetical protein